MQSRVQVVNDLGARLHGHTTNQIWGKLWGGEIWDLLWDPLRDRLWIEIGGHVYACVSDWCYET